MHLEYLTPLTLLITALAAHRLTRLWIKDTLPPLPKIRGWLQYKLRHSKLVELTNCPWCAGFWIAAASTLLASTGVWWLWVAIPLAISTIIGLLEDR